MSPRLRQLLTQKKEILPALLSLVYLIGLYSIGELRSDHLVILGSVLALYYAHDKTRRLVVGMFPLVLFAIIYDFMRVYPNHIANAVNIQEPYEIEKFLFGFSYNGELIIPNEYFGFEANRNVVFDFLGGLFYGTWIAVPIAVAVVLFFVDKRLIVHFCWVFFLCNLLGIATYYLYPAAPPWYVAEYGFQFKSEVAGNPARLLAFDQMFGITFFQDLYSRNPNPFAAVPSMHSAYPLLVLTYSIRRLKYTNIVLVVHMLGIWFSAVYLNHHYIIDVLLGIGYALFTYWMFEALAHRWQWLNDKISFLEAYITGNKTNATTKPLYNEEIVVTK